MKRRRTRLNNKPVSSDGSDSEDDRPLKKPSPDKKVVNNNDDEDSSSESDLEKYLKKPNSLDLKSAFFNTNIVKSTAADEESSGIGDTIITSKNPSGNDKDSSDPDDNVKDEEICHKSSIQNNFTSFQNYMKNMEETKKHIELQQQHHQHQIKKKSSAKDNIENNIATLLATGEKITGPNTDLDLHSSDFESNDDDDDDQDQWEEIHINTPQSNVEKKLIPSKGLQITVDMPGHVKKKKGIDLIAAMKRRLNRIRKENQILIHKVHLLCFIGHGNYVNSIINQAEFLSTALSLIPSEKSFPSGRIDLSYLEQIVTWYKRAIKVKKETSHCSLSGNLEESLKKQISKKECRNQKIFVLIFVAILRALGVQVRFVLNLVVEPLRPPATELHSLSTKISGKNEKKANSGMENEPSTSGLNTTSKSKKSGPIKITIQKSTPVKKKSEKAILLKTKSIQKSSIRQESAQKRTITNKPDKENNKKVKNTKDAKSLVPNTRSRTTKSANSENGQNVEKNSTNKLTVPKIHRKRTKSDESENSENNAQQNPRRRRTKSIEQINSADSDGQSFKAKKDLKQTKNNDTKLLEVPKLRDRTKSTNSEKDLKVKVADKNKLAAPKGKSRRKSDELENLSESDTNRKKRKEQTDLALKENKQKSKEVNNKKTNAGRTSAKVNKKQNTKKIPQVDGIFDSESEEISQLDGGNDKKNLKPNLKKLKKKPTTKKLQTHESSASDSEFESVAESVQNRKEKSRIQFEQLKNYKKNNNDVVKIIKNRIAEEKHKSATKKITKKHKPSINDDMSDDSDSDFLPETASKKKIQENEINLVSKTKVKRRIPAKPVVDGENAKPKKLGCDIWIEVFLEDEEKWISVDLMGSDGSVHCVKELAQHATHPICYILAWDNNNNLKDVTQRYCPNFNTITRKLRIDSKWWNESLRPFIKSLPTAQDREEDEDLAMQQIDQPLPKSISEYKNHPLYVLKRHLLKFEAIYPPEPETVGFIRGEAVYPRKCVYTLHSRDIWLKQAKVVRLGQEPYKIVKARPKWDKLSNKAITDQLLEIFGPWQVEDYEPPTAVNGIVPRNAFGNVDLFKICMLPKGCVHLKLASLNRVARKLNIDCASAIVGFDFHGGWSHPVYDGFVVCKEYEEKLVKAWEVEQDELDRKEQEKIDKRVYGNWKRLIKGLLIRERLNAKYGFGKSSSSSTNSLSGAAKDKNKTKLAKK